MAIYRIFLKLCRLNSSGLKLSYFNLFCIVILLLSVTTSLVAAPLPAADGLIVKFRTSTSQSSQIHALSTSGLRTVESFNLVPGLTHVRAVAGETIQSTLDAIKTNPNVEYAEPNYYVTALGIPNDPDFSKQYGLYNTGQTGGEIGADIDAVNAWDLQTGKDVVIAIVDTGVDYNHPELTGNIWTNVNEIPGNGIDDDNNGFVDDVYGWDFSNNDNDPLDDMGHGTHVAGIIAAKANNGIGISGINWRAKIMSLKFIDAAGIGTTSNAIKAINYAILMKAKISNNSWGGGAYSQGLYETLIAAQNAGHLFVAASGNTATDSDAPGNSKHYPSSYDLNNVISVAATDEFDKLGSFSNYGAVSVDLAAPGRQILSLWLNNSYMSLDGTSMAAPFVAGAAGLLLSTRPNLTIPELRAALLNNVDRLPSLSGLMVTGGRLNLFKSINSISAAIKVTPLDKHITTDSNLQFFASGGTLPYTWSVSNPSVAQINSASGLLLASRTGITQVIVRDVDGFSARTGDIVIEQLSISPVISLLDLGQTIQFVPDGGVPPYSWVSSNSRVIQIDRVSGLATAVSTGQGAIILQDSNGITFQTDIIEVVFIAELNLRLPLGSFNVGGTYQFSADGGVPPYRFGSLDTFVATIDPDSGVMKARRSGLAQIYVDDALGSRAVQSDIPIQTIEVFSTTNTMRINERQQLSVRGGTAPFEWRVTNSLVASIDLNGLLTALSSGSIKVTVMDIEGNVAATDIIAISTSAALSFTPPSTIVAKDETFLLKVSGGVAPYRWNVSNAAVLTVNQITQIATARGEGVSFITVIDSLGESNSSNVIEVRDIKIFPQTSEFIVKDSVQFSAAGGVEPYSWSINDSNLARIDRSGNFSVTAAGFITLTVTDADGIKKSIDLILSNNSFVSPMFEITPRSAILSKRSSNGLTFMATGGTAPYTYSLSSPIGAIDSVTGKYNPQSDVGGKTTIVVTDALGNVQESGVISIR